MVTMSTENCNSSNLYASLSILNTLQVKQHCNEQFLNIYGSLPFLRPSTRPFTDLMVAILLVTIATVHPILLEPFPLNPLDIKTYILAKTLSLYSRKHWNNRNFSKFSPLTQPSWTPSGIFKIARGWKVHTTLDLIIYTPKISNQQRKNQIRELRFTPIGCKTR